MDIEVIRVHLLSSFYIPERHPWGGVPFPLIHRRWARWDFRGRPLKKDPFFEASKNRIFTITLLSFHMHLKNGFSGG